MLTGLREVATNAAGVFHGATAFCEIGRNVSSAFYEYRRMPKEPQTLFGRRLRAARMQAGIAQERLGQRIGLDEGSSSARISRYETGANEPAFRIAERLADILSVPVAYFYCTDERIAEIVLGLARLSDDEIGAVREIVLRMAGKTS